AHDAQDASCVLQSANGSPSFHFALALGTAAANQDNRLFVRTRNAAGDVSSEDFVTVTQDSSVPDAPANVHVNGISGGVVVSWAKGRGIAAAFRVYCGPGPPRAAAPPDRKFAALAGEFAGEGASPIVINNPDTTSLTLTTIANGTRVYAGVTAF